MRPQWHRRAQVRRQVVPPPPQDRLLLVAGRRNLGEFYHDQIFPLFYEQHPDIQMETTIIGSWTDLYNKLVTSTAGGAPPS
ncbi:MAG: hypothetical protein R2932_02605 [Caldilineaceae bacterium]